MPPAFVQYGWRRYHSKRCSYKGWLALCPMDVHYKHSIEFTEVRLATLRMGICSETAGPLPLAEHLQSGHRYLAVSPVLEGCPWAHIVATRS